MRGSWISCGLICIGCNVTTWRQKIKYIWVYTIQFGGIFSCVFKLHLNQIHEEDNNTIDVSVIQFKIKFTNSFILFNEMICHPFIWFIPWDDGKRSVMARVCDPSFAFPYFYHKICEVIELAIRVWWWNIIK